MEQESGVGESPKCRSNTILTSTPGKTQISKKDYTTEYTTTPECSDLNKAGFLEDMELETEEASGQMVRKNVSWGVKRMASKLGISVKKSCLIIDILEQGFTT